MCTTASESKVSWRLTCIQGWLKQNGNVGTTELWLPWFRTSFSRCAGPHLTATHCTCQSYMFHWSWIIKFIQVPTEQPCLLWKHSLYLAYHPLNTCRKFLMLPLFLNYKDFFQHIKLSWAVSRLLVSFHEMLSLLQQLPNNDLGLEGQCRGILSLPLHILNLLTGDKWGFYVST